MRNYEGFEGKVALVTGGAVGIGKAICLDFAKQGAKIVIADINLEAAQKTVAELEATGTEAFAVHMDVSNEAAVEAGFKAAIEKFGTIDILVNNAAFGGKDLAIPHLFAKPLTDWEPVFKIGLFGIVYCVKQVYELFKERGSGKIVNISSISARMPTVTIPEYAAMKAGVLQYTKAIAKDMAPYGINVNAICPGFLWTDMWEMQGILVASKFPEEARPEPYQVFEEMVKKLVPMGTPQQVEDIAYLATFLCSERASQITGQAINVDGGTVMT